MNIFSASVEQQSKMLAELTAQELELVSGGHDCEKPKLTSKIENGTISEPVLDY